MFRRRRWVVEEMGSRGGDGKIGGGDGGDG